MDKNYKSIGERIIDNGYFMRDDRLAGKDDGRYDIRNIIDMFSKGIELPEKISDEDRGSLSSVEEIFQEDSPYTEDAFGSSEGFTLSPLTMIRRYLAEKELKRKKKGLANGGMTNMLGTGGITGNKTYHQYHDQFVPMDSESMGYMNGGGVGSMMQPRMNFAGGGGDFIGLNPNDTSIQIEDLTETDNNGNFLISAADALPDQTGTISSMPSITNNNLRTIEGSLIDGDDPSSRYAVQQDFKSDRPFDRDFSLFDKARMGNANQIPDRNRGQVIERNPSAPFNRGFTMADVANTATGPFDRDFSSFDEARMGAPANSSLGYQDGIMGMVGNDPFAGMNALEKDIAKQAMNTSQTEFDGDFNSEFYNDNGIYTKQKGEPILAENRGNILKNLVNKDTNMFGYQKKPTGILTNIKNDIGSLFSSAKDGITSLGGRFKEGASKFPSLIVQAANFRNPLNPKASNYNPNLVGQLNALDGMNGMLVNNANSGLLQYGPNSVLSGQNAISGFGTNDYLGQLEKKQAYFDRRIAANKKYNKDTYAATLAEIKVEKARQEEAEAAAVAEIRASAPAFNFNTTSGGRGNYRSDRDNSRDGGYGGSSKRIRG